MARLPIFIRVFLNRTRVKSIRLQGGNDLTIIGTGETVYHALCAGRKLAAEGISNRVIDMHTLKPADTEAIIRAAK